MLLFVRFVYINATIVILLFSMFINTSSHPVSFSLAVRYDTQRDLAVHVGGPLGGLTIRDISVFSRIAGTLALWIQRYFGV